MTDLAFKEYKDRKIKILSVFFSLFFKGSYVRGLQSFARTFIETRTKTSIRNAKENDREKREREGERAK